jgi:hypothetical protein
MRFVDEHIVEARLRDGVNMATDFLLDHCKLTGQSQATICASARWCFLSWQRVNTSAFLATHIYTPPLLLPTKSATLSKALQPIERYNSKSNSTLQPLTPH